MKLDRNIFGNEGRGKYALLDLRKLREFESSETFSTGSKVQQAMDTLRDCGLIQWGSTGEQDEFFVLKLKDRFSQQALLAYCDAVSSKDLQFALEVYELVQRSGPNSPFCKDPD